MIKGELYTDTLRQQINAKIEKEIKQLETRLKELKQEQEEIDYTFYIDNDNYHKPFNDFTLADQLQITKEVDGAAAYFLEEGTGDMNKGEKINYNKSLYDFAQDTFSKQLKVR